MAIDIVPHTSQHILSYLSHTFWLGRSEVEEDLVDQLFNSSEKRLARILLLLANLAAFHSITSLEALQGEGCVMRGSNRQEHPLDPPG